MVERGKVMEIRMNFGLVAITAMVLSLPALAAPTEADKKTVTSKAYVDTDLLEKQDAIAGRASGSSYAMTYPSTTGGQPTARQISTSLANDTNLATRAAINGAINVKQDKITGGTANTVVLYNSSGGVTNTSKPIYNASGAYNSTTSQNLTQVNHVNSAVIKGFNEHLVCRTWTGSSLASDNSNCLTYEVMTLSGTYVPENQ